jgi:hypothetical protein
MSEQSDLVATTFRDLLHRAVTSGQRPRRTLLLGPATWAAIDALACEHPDATPDHFAAAHDAFALEHRHAEEMREFYDADPLTARAAEYAAIDALVGQLRISYPAVDPETIDSVVRRIHAGFDGHAVRDFVPLFVERAAHQRFA